MVSTDGHRLTQVDCPDTRWKREGMILPSAAVSQLRKDLKGLDKIKVAQSKDKLALKTTNPNWSMVTKLIDGTFPDYRRVIPTDLDGSFSVALTGRCPGGATSVERSQHCPAYRSRGIPHVRAFAGPR
ncbi:hypothetical protein [Paracoccus methylarcula]|uniref:Beta sliding clamp n=1 Tax=Paracoccus methylarcula TaxID=72022 RepID=A0A422QW53_9RHOB|nr:hypothetical protein [Paracoccus methylarcula]RNF34195.1 hypothetical protein A7A09_012380 [Paracoccus methylarcula]